MQNSFVIGIHSQLIIYKTIILPTVYTSMKHSQERGNNWEMERGIC